MRAISDSCSKSNVGSAACETAQELNKNIKFILEEKLEPSDPKVLAVRDQFFGFWEGTWVAFNFARDFKLDGYDTERLNYFMYPLLAAAKIRPDGVDPQETGYSFKATPLPL